MRVSPGSAFVRVVAILLPFWVAPGTFSQPNPERPLGKVSLPQGPKAHTPIRHGTAIGVIGSLGNPHSFLCRNSPLGEGAALGKTAGEVPAGEHRDETRHTEALLEQCTVETRHILSVALHRLVIVPQAAVGESQCVLRHNREAKIPRGSGHCQGALATLEGAVQFAYRHKMDGQIGGDPPQPLLVAQRLSESRGVL